MWMLIEVLLAMGAKLAQSRRMLFFFNPLWATIQWLDWNARVSCWWKKSMMLSKRSEYIADCYGVLFPEPLTLSSHPAVLGEGCSRGHSSDPWQLPLQWVQARGAQGSHIGNPTVSMRYLPHTCFWFLLLFFIFWSGKLGSHVVVCQICTLISTQTEASRSVYFVLTFAMISCMM